jgi:hypothetical protein
MLNFIDVEPWHKDEVRDMTQPDGSDQNDKTVTLEVYSSEPLARMAAGRLELEGIQCMVRAVGVGPGGWGVAATVPHALDTWEDDAELAREILDIAPTEAKGQLVDPEAAQSRFPITVMLVLAVVVVAIVIQTADAVFSRIFE